jgi:hypothetical protein
VQDNVDQHSSYSPFLTSPSYSSQLQTTRILSLAKKEIDKKIHGTKQKNESFKNRHSQKNAETRNKIEIDTTGKRTRNELITKPSYQVFKVSEKFRTLGKS